MDGPALIRFVRAQLPALPILYLQNQEQTRDGPPEGLPADVPTLREPFSPEQLLSAVRPLLGGAQA